MKLAMDVYMAKNKINQALFNLFRKKKMEAPIRQSLQNLEKVVKEIRLPANVE